MDHVANYGGGGEKGDLDMVDMPASSAGRRNKTATVDEDRSLDDTQTEEI